MFGHFRTCMEGLSLLLCLSSFNSLNTIFELSPKNVLYKMLQIFFGKFELISQINFRGEKTSNNHFTTFFVSTNRFLNKDNRYNNYTKLLNTNSHCRYPKKNRPSHFVTQKLLKILTLKFYYFYLT